MPVALKSRPAGDRPRLAVVTVPSRDQVTPFSSRQPRTSPAASQASVRPLPKTHRPLWLHCLVAAQMASAALAAGVVGVAIMTYASTVQTERQLVRATNTLQRLQQQEQQLSAASAMLDNYLAEQTAAMVSPADQARKPVIFLESEPAAAIAPAPAPTTAKQPRTLPLGY